ncbi:hypothetical protein JOB18_034161 [Solea senegalensis]|uniref:Uncharacterized protein n=1 Tax=Solea senegalensis TaxID=28829 RepID=A0AAV6RWM1_SOLSE|nr:hypothetical protein JOB18_034161 [Solea senegalensis]
MENKPFKTPISMWLTSSSKRAPVHRPTTWAQDVTLLRADLHLNKYVAKPKTMSGPKRGTGVSPFGQVQLILPNPAQLQGNDKTGGTAEYEVLHGSHPTLYRFIGTRVDTKKHWIKMSIIELCH